MSNMKSRIYTLISLIMLLVIGSGIITYTKRDPNLYVQVKTNKYWVTLKEITPLELGNYEMIIWYHNGTIDASDIDFSDNSTTLLGYEKVYYHRYTGITIIDDHMREHNANIGLVRKLIELRMRMGGKLTW